MLKQIIRPVLTLMSGTGLAQVITFLSLPIITRLYSPDDIGAWATILSITSVAIVVGTLQYSQAVLIANRIESIVLARVAVYLASAVSLLFCCISIFFLDRLIDDSSFSAAALASIIVFSFCSFSVYQSLLVRDGDFGKVAWLYTIRAVTVGVTQIVLYDLNIGFLGLLIGNAVAESLILIVARSYVRKKTKYRVGRFYIRLWKVSVTKFKQFPLYTTPQSLMYAASQAIPIMHVANNYSLLEAGLYGIANKLVLVPSTLIGNSLRQALFYNFREKQEDYDYVLKSLVKVTSYLFLLLSISSILFYYLAELLFEIVFGESWRKAGTMARVMFIGQAVMFCNIPASVIAVLMRDQRNVMVFHAVHLLLYIIIAMFTPSEFILINLVGLYAISNILLGVAIVFRAYTVVKKKMLYEC